VHYLKKKRLILL